MDIGQTGLRGQTVQLHVARDLKPGTENVPTQITQCTVKNVQVTINRQEIVMYKHAQVNSQLVNTKALFYVLFYCVWTYFEILSKFPFSLVQLRRDEIVLVLV